MQGGNRWSAGLAIVVLLSAGVSAGCFKYVPVATTAVNPEEEVRLRVTTDAAVRIGPRLGTISERLEGRLAPAGDSVDFAIWIGKDYTGSPFENARLRVSLARPEIVEVRRRTLSRTRTGLAAAGILAVTALLVNQVVFEENKNPPGSDNPHPPPTDGFRVQLRIR
jgi:hypothetical protein